MATTSGLPSQQVQNDFASYMKAGDYKGAAQLGRGLGYSDADIAQYVGNTGQGDKSAAASWLSSNPYTQQAGVQQSAGQQGYNPNLINGQQSAAVAKVDPNSAQGAQAASMGAAQVQGFQGDSNTQSLLNNDYKNPYLDAQVSSAMGRLGDNFNQALGGIRSSAVSNGSYGGSRQGIAEGIAAKGLAQSSSDLAGNMYSNAYNTGFGARANLTGQLAGGQLAANQANAGFQQGANQANAGFQQNANNQNSAFGQQAALTNAGFQNQNNQFNANLGMQGQQFNANAQNQAGQFNSNLGQQNNQFNAQQGNSYDLGMRGNMLGNEQLNSNIYNSNFNNSLNAGRFGLDAFSTMNNMNNQGLNNGTTMNNQPMNQFNQTNGNTMAAAGTGQANQIAPQGNSLMAGVGAGLSTYGGINNYLRTTTGP